MTLRGVEITMAANEARLQGLRDLLLDVGSGTACVRFFADAERPAFGEPSALPMLVELPLARPCGEIVAGRLRLLARDAAGAMILESGIATWGRIVSAAGALVMDVDVSAEGGEGQIQIPDSTQLYAGGYFTLAPTSYIE